MICPRCGAENQPSAKICRMCATPLETAGPTVMAPAKNPYPAGGMREGKSAAPSGPATPGPGEALCPTCKAVNDANWSYCQQCGSPLHKASPAAGNIEPFAAPIAPSAAAPAISNKSPGPARSAVSVSPPTVAPSLASPAANNVPRTTEGAGKTLTCLSCNRVNTPGSSYCASCGAQLPVDQTLIMSTARPATPVLPKLRLIQEGGGDGEIYKLDTDETVIGRNSGDIRFPHDGYMSGRHARIIRRGERFILVDENSRNGTFKRIDGEVELKAGDIILIGKQLFRFEL